MPAGTPTPKRSKFQDELMKESSGSVSSEIDTNPKITSNQAFAMGAGQEITMGLDDELVAVFTSLGSQDYEERRDAIRMLHKLAQKQHPDSYDNGKWVGIVASVAPLLISGVGIGAGLTNVARAIGKLGFKKFVTKSIPAGQRVVKSLKHGPISKKMKKKILEGVPDDKRKRILENLKISEGGSLKNVRTPKTTKAPRDIPKERMTAYKQRLRAIEGTAGNRRKGELLEDLGDVANRKAAFEGGKALLYHSAKTGATMGGIEGWGKSEGGTIPDLLLDTAKGAGVGSLMSVAFPILGAGIKGTAKGVGSAAKFVKSSVIESLTGLTKVQISWLKKNPELFKNAKSFHDVEVHFKDMVGELVKAKGVYAKKANKYLRGDKAVDSNKIKNDISELIETEVDRLAPGGKMGVGPSAENTKKYFKMLEAFEIEITNQLEGGVSEVGLNALSQQWKQQAQQYKDHLSPHANEMAAKFLKKVRYKWKETLGESNPNWNRAMEPVRKILHTLRGDESIGKKGVNDIFGFTEKGEKLYDKETLGGTDKFFRQWVSTVSAPFFKDGLRKHQISRDLVDNVTDLTRKYSPKYKHNPKLKKENILKEGEGVVAQERVASGKNPETGAMNVWQTVFSELGGSLGANAFVKAVSGIVGATVRQNMGKRLGAEMLTQKNVVPSELMKKITSRIPTGANAAESLTRASVGRMTDSPDIATQKDLIDSRKFMESNLEERRKGADPGEEYGIPGHPFGGPGFEGIKTPEPIKPDQVLPDQSNFNDDDKEKQTREKNALRFLSQQKERSKPKYT